MDANPKKEPVLCYVSGMWAYFTTKELSEQWGDDWNDAPYELNAGTPYDPTMFHYADGRQEKNPRDWNEDGTPKWHIVKVAWEGPFETPVEVYSPNSNFSVQDINAGMTPWLKTSNHHEGSPVQIMAGVTISEFTRLMRVAGGHVYSEE